MALLRIASFAIKNEENISGGGGQAFEEDCELDPKDSNNGLPGWQSPKQNVKRERRDEENINYEPPSFSGGRSATQRSSPEEGPLRERKYFGPYGKQDNEISVRYSTDIDGYYGDTKDRKMMEQMGLPTGFTSESSRMSHHIEEGTIRERGKRGEKKTYYCEICMIELNSFDTMNSHIKGVKHMKKKLSNNQQLEEKVRRGEPVSRKPLGVVQIDNPEPTKKKVPIRLHEKIKETMDPVVGLEWIKEFIAVSDAEMEPHYECTLCGKQGQANGMFSHLMGHAHRQKFVDQKFDDDPNYMDLSQKELLNLAGKYSENDQRISDLITTRRSDEQYPWPPGKAPWSIEKGGTGIAPDKARENWGKNNPYKVEKLEKEEKYERNPWKQHDRSRSPEVAGSRAKQREKPYDIPNPQSLEKPRDLEEAAKYLETGIEMLKFVVDFDGMFSRKEKHLHQANIAAIMNGAARGMEKETSHGHLSPSRSPEEHHQRKRSHSRSIDHSPQRSREESHQRKRSRSRSSGHSPHLYPEGSHQRSRVKMSRSRSPSTSRSWRRS